MWRVETGSRLHFGLLSLAPFTGVWDDPVPPRRFGGLGMMVARPGLAVSVRLAVDKGWSAIGPHADRALGFAQRLAESRRAEDPVALPCHIVVERAPTEHIGLGTGTQLGMAVATALARTWGWSDDSADLACRIGRGERSALGIHGFAYGGVVLDGGKSIRGSSARMPAPLLARYAFPPQWRVVLAFPMTQGFVGVHGVPEQEAISRLSSESLNTERLCRLVLLGLLPALIEEDLATFSLALHEFNAIVGKAFAYEQGGEYARDAADLIHWLRSIGIVGVGQSSWGPTVFAVLGDSVQADQLAVRLRARGVEAIVTEAGTGRTVLPCASFEES